MEKAVSCKRCGESVDLKAKTCPQCGVTDPGVKLKDLVLGFVALGVLGWLALTVLGWMFGSDSGDDAAAATAPAAASAMPAPSHPVADPVPPTARETRDYISRLDDLATPDAQVRALADGSVLLRNYNIRLYALAHQGDERWPLLHDCRLAGWDAVSLWEQAKLLASEPERASRQDEYADALERYQQQHDVCLAGAAE